MSLCPGADLMDIHFSSQESTDQNAEHLSVTVFFYPGTSGILYLHHKGVQRPGIKGDVVTVQLGLYDPE